MNWSELVETKMEHGMYSFNFVINNEILYRITKFRLSV